MNAAVNFMPQLLYPHEKRFVISGLEAGYAKLPPLTCGGQEMPDPSCPAYSHYTDRQTDRAIQKL